MDEESHGDLEEEEEEEAAQGEDLLDEGPLALEVSHDFVGMYTKACH